MLYKSTGYISNVLQFAVVCHLNTTAKGFDVAYAKCYSVHTNEFGELYCL